MCRIIDSKGNPVEGAEVGVGAHFGITGPNQLRPGRDGWLFRLRTISSEAGIAKLDDDESDDTVIVARHGTKTLFGHSRVRSKNDEGVVTIRLTEAHQLIGQLTCADLTDQGLPMPFCSVTLKKEGQTLARYFSRDGTFSFPVCEGAFQLRAHGNLARETIQDVTITNAIERCEVKIDLPAKRLVLLQGTVAPAIQEIIEWKNGPAIQPADCRGNYLLIDFWGHWCGPCLRNMPHLIDLEEQLGGEGLKIIGVHVDSGEGIDSVQKLDEKLDNVRQQLWSGRDIPFPVALVRARKVIGATRNDHDARSRTAARYGVIGYPTCILVDPAGRIVKEFRVHNSKDRQALRTLIKQWSSTGS